VTPPYSEATVELAARASFESEFGPAGREMWATTSASSQEIYLSEARFVLDALAAAGLLLPEGAEPRTDYGMEYTFPGDDPITVPAASREAAERTAESGNRTGYARHRVVERTSWSTPWSPVPPEPKGDA
jgi:hypothetical protein